MDTVYALAIIALAGFIHSSFQLSVSVLTLISGRALSTKRSHKRLLGLTSSFIFGVGLMTLLLLSALATVLVDVFDGQTPIFIWAMAGGLLFGVAIAVWLFYYRRESGTALWIPRPMAEYLHSRTKATRSTTETFGLGMMSVLGELLFVIAPLVIASLVLVTLPPIWQLAGIALYALTSLFSLIVVLVLLGSGHKLSDIQKWREDNKYFLQFAAGAGLIVLAFCSYATEVVGINLGSI